MDVKISEKNLQQILTGVVMDVLDPTKNFKKQDCEKALAISSEVVKTLKELNFFN